MSSKKPPTKQQLTTRAALTKRLKEVEKQLEKCTETTHYKHLVDEKSILVTKLTSNPIKTKQPDIVLPLNIRT